MASELDHIYINKLPLITDQDFERHNDVHLCYRINEIEIMPLQLMRTFTLNPNAPTCLRKSAHIPYAEVRTIEKESTPVLCVIVRTEARYFLVSLDFATQSWKQLHLFAF